MTLTPQQLESCRRQFPALARRVGDQPAVFFDGPAGTQVPNRVIDAIGDYLRNNNANHGGAFVTSRLSDSLLGSAHQAVADLLGANDADCVAFGPNMTTHTFAFSRALSRTWRAGDEVVVTRLDHDANVTPWVLAARDAGAEVRYVSIRREDCTLDLDELRGKLTNRTRLVAIGGASNSTGGLNPVEQIVEWAHDAGAEVFVDAVHLAPHARIDVNRLGCDYLACSVYKFFGPHVGVLWGRRERLEALPAYKLRPASDELPSKWMTGTQNHECIAGTLAAIDYLADLGRTLAMSPGLKRREALDAAYRHIREYEIELSARLLAGSANLKRVRVWGITDPARLHERVPTVSITHSHLKPRQLAEHLDERGIFVWHGNYYALGLTETLGLEPEGMVRIGLVHYNTPEEIDRLMAALAELE
jgi:cysteine desulfurase family protein (TIGR01976 family)